MKKRVAISLKLPEALLDELETVRQTLPAVPTKTAVIEAALIEWLKVNRPAKSRK